MNALKTKFIILITLMLGMGVFCFPTTSYGSDFESAVTLNVSAAVDGEILRIRASGGFMGVEAIFINGQRFNFRVDGILNVDLLAFTDSEALSVYAVDFAGNRSNVVTIENPHFHVPIIEPPQPPQGIPITTRQTNAFTPDGQAGVLDNATDGDEKEFFTFQTPAGNIFYLIVDRQRESDNVYFLNAVTEQDLIALAAQAGNEIAVSGDGGIPISTIPLTPAEPSTDCTEDDEPESDIQPIERESNNGTMIFLLIAMLIAGGVGYYFKIVRPKQQSQDDDYADEDEEDLGEEMEFENEADENDEGGDDEVETEDDGL
jgi:hypothetical protein